MLGVAAMMEATAIDTLTKTLLVDFEDLLAPLAVGEQYFDRDMLEHLADQKSRMELLLSCLRGFDPRDNEIIWEGEYSTGSGEWTGDWIDFIDPDEANIPAFYTDYGRQKVNLASHAMFQYTELALAAVESIEQLR